MEPIRPKEEMLETLAEYYPENFVKIWEVFLSKISENGIEEWAIDQNKKFSLKLTHPLKMWVPKKSKNDPKGGTILRIGMCRNRVLTGTLHSWGLEVKEGFSTFCRNPISPIPRWITAKINRISINKEDQTVTFCGRWGPFTIPEYPKKLSGLAKYWSEGEIVETCEKSFIKQKLKSS